MEEPLVEKRLFQQMNKLVEQETFIDSVKLKIAELKGRFFVQVFCSILFLWDAEPEKSCVVHYNNATRRCPAVFSY